MRDLNLLIKKHILDASGGATASRQVDHVCPMNTRGANRHRLEKSDLKLKGGYHETVTRGAGACVVAPAEADRQVGEIIAELKRNG